MLTPRQPLDYSEEEDRDVAADKAVLIFALIIMVAILVWATAMATMKEDNFPQGVQVSRMIPSPSPCETYCRWCKPGECPRTCDTCPRR